MNVRHSETTQPDCSVGRTFVEGTNSWAASEKRGQQLVGKARVTFVGTVEVGGGELASWHGDFELLQVD